MKILKFGGTSVGSPQRMKDVCQLINDGTPKIVVLSAMSGTTNSLVEISDYIKKSNPEAANNVINHMHNKYMEHVEHLYAKQETIDKTKALLSDIFMQLHYLTASEYSVALEKEILAQGELMSSNMLTNYLQEQGTDVRLIPALDYMLTDDKGEPDMSFIREGLEDILGDNRDCNFFITQGFICRNFKGEIDNLQRGGSDYTACLIGAVLGAEEIQIWTDIDGMHNNDHVLFQIRLLYVSLALRRLQS